MKIRNKFFFLFGLVLFVEIVIITFFKSFFSKISYYIVAFNAILFVIWFYKSVKNKATAK